MEDYGLYTIEGAPDGVLGQYTSKAHTAKDGQSLFIASTSQEDRHGDIVRQDWKLAQFKANPVILWMHDHRQPPIGKAVAPKVEERGKPGARLVMGVEWDNKGEHNPLAVTVAEQVKNGYLNTGSVGFVPGKKTFRNQLPSDHAAYMELSEGRSQWSMGMYLEKNNLLEFSITTIPANPGVQAVRSWAKEAEDPQEQIRRLLDETVERRVRELMLSYLKTDQEIQDSIVAAYLGSPEPADPVMSFNDTLASLLRSK